MSYSCVDFVDTILDALGIVVPIESADSPSDQADLALAALDKLRKGKPAPGPAVVHVVTHTCRFGPASYAFSSREAADAFCIAFVRKRWAENHPHEPIPDYAQDMWDRWAELEPDESIEQDEMTIDEHSPAPKRGPHEISAERALAHLQTALALAKSAGAKRTAERIKSAISSGKGAVRAARYRDQDAAP